MSTSLPELPKPSRTPRKSQKPIFRGLDEWFEHVRSTHRTLHTHFLTPQVKFPGLEPPIQVKMLFLFLFFSKKVGCTHTGFWLFPGVLEGLGSSGRLIGTVSTYPGTYLCPGSRVMIKNPRGGTFSSGHGIGPFKRSI